MAQSHPTMTKTMKLTDARAHFSEVLAQVFRGEGRILVQKSGIPVAGIVSAADLERLARLDAQRAQDFAVLDEIGAAFDDEDPETLEREVARALAAVRRKQRAKQAPSTPEA